MMSRRSITLSLLSAALFSAAASSAHASGIEANQTRPGRPLVLNSGAADLHAAFVFDINDDNGDPDLTAFNVVRLPIGADFGIGGGLELGALLSNALHPSFATSLQLRARFGFNDVVGIGLLTTVPLGYLSARIGPEALPLVFEAPVLRFEGVDAAMQAALRWYYTIQDGDDGNGMDANIAGIFRIGTSAFATRQPHSMSSKDG